MAVLSKKFWPKKIETTIATIIGAENLHSRHWVDHQYTEVDHEGDKFYVTHPYDLSGLDIEDLTRIENAGYQVIISAESEYSPAQTLKVIIRDPRPS